MSAFSDLNTSRNSACTRCIGKRKYEYTIYIQYTVFTLLINSVSFQIPILTLVDGQTKGYIDAWISKSCQRAPESESHRSEQETFSWLTLNFFPFHFLNVPCSHCPCDVFSHLPCFNRHTQQTKLTIAALAGSAPACCMVSPGACSIHCRHLAIGHRNLVGVGLITVGEKKRKRFKKQTNAAAAFCGALNQNPFIIHTYYHLAVPGILMILTSISEY